MGNLFSSVSGTAFDACVVTSYTFSLALFLAPLPTIIRICKKKSVEQFSPIPYLTTFLNCMLWVFYGQPSVHVNPDSILVAYINCVGLVPEAIYLIIFFVYSPKKLRCKILAFVAAELVFMTAAVGIVLTAFHRLEHRCFIVGVLCVLSGTIHAVIKLMIQTKSIAFMPYSLSFVGTLHALCWTIFGLILSDQYVTIQHCIGLLLGMAQLLLYWRYFSSTPKEEEEGGHVTMRPNLPLRARNFLDNRLGSSNERDFTVLILYPESSRGQQLMRKIKCSPLVESGDTIGTVISWTADLVPGEVE